MRYDLHCPQLRVSIDVVDNKGCTPLIIASQYGQTMLVGYLIGKGATLFITDKEGDTALHWAAFKGTIRQIGRKSGQLSYKIFGNHIKALAHIIQNKGKFLPGNVLRDDF